MASYGLIHPPSGDLHHCTHPFLHIRHANDAHRLFEAVRLKMLPLITKRLSPTERDLLASGQVFVWEEASTTATSSSSSSHSSEDTSAATSTAAHTSGLERWTDGRRWSQSRMREPFLFYEEKVSTTPEEKHQKAVRRARKASSTSVSTSNNDPSSWPDVPPGPIRRQDRPTKPDGLTKQTYSSLVHVDGDPNSPPRKWHCVAYFSASDFSKLPTIDYYPALRSIAVPDGVYTSTKGLGRLVAGATPNAVGNATIIRRRPGSVGVESAAGGNYSSLTSDLGRSSSSSTSRQRAGSDWSTRYDDKIEEFTWQQPPPPPSSTSSIPPIHLAQPLQYHPRSRVGTAAHGRASISSSSGSTATDRSSPSTPPGSGYAMEEDLDDRDSLPPLPPPSMYHHNHHHHHHHHQTTSLPSLPPVSAMLPPIKTLESIGSGWERSREDSAAIGAFRLQL